MSLVTMVKGSYFIETHENSSSGPGIAPGNSGEAVTATPFGMPSFADALNRIGFFYLLNCFMADSRPSMVNGYI